MNQFSPGAFLYILLVALLIVARNLRPRRIRVKSLWISPTVITVLSIYVLAVVPDQTPVWLRTVAGVIGAALGGAFGFFRGKVTAIKILPLRSTAAVAEQIPGANYSV
jgi:hypothetical protein